jgi:general secretion pathway protein G
MREAIDKYYSDNGKYPNTLNDLVIKKYLRSIPPDPITESTQTWLVIPPAGALQVGVYDVKSGAPGNALDGTPYSQW